MSTSIWEGGKDMRPQLILSQKELEDIGFAGKYETGDELNDACAWWQFPIINGFIIFNPNKPPYCWYLKIEIGEAANWLHLDIAEILELISLFKLLQIKIENLFDHE